MNARDSILLDYSYLEEGQTITGETCPSCNSTDRSLAVSRREGRLLWICYRASCTFKGSSAGGMGYTGTKQVSTRAATGRQYLRTAASLPEGMASLLYEKYAITTEEIAKHKLGWTEDRLVLPVNNVLGESDGCVLRSLNGAVPKALTHSEPEALAWYRNRSSDALIVVEDQLSAICASRYVNSVALLGTNFNQERATTIRKARFSKVMLALDADAFDVAVKFARMYRTYLPMTLLRLEKDIKDMDEEDTRSLLTA